MTQARVGLIGCGHIGAFHSKAIRQVQRRELLDVAYVAVADREVERARSFAALAGVPRVTGDPYELIASSEVNAVYICTHTAEHPALVAAAARAGKAIFCEKPLARTLAEVREMVRAVEEAGVPNQVGLVLRHAPVFVVLRALLADERAGRPMAVSFRDDQFFPVGGEYDSTWRGEFAAAGGGTLIEHSIHDVDLLRWLLGEAEQVSAVVRCVSGRAGVEDVAMVRIEHAGGAVANLSSVWHEVRSRGSDRGVEVFCEHAYFALWDDYLGPLYVDYGDGTGTREISRDEVLARHVERAGLGEAGTRLGDAARGDFAPRYGLEDLAFLRAVTEGVPAWPGFGEALAAHVIVDAAYRSAAAGGTPVRLTPRE